MIDWNSHGQRKNVRRLHEEINRLAHPEDGRVDYSKIVQRTRQLRSAYLWEAMKDVYSALKRGMDRIGRNISFDECVGRKSH